MLCKFELLYVTVSSPYLLVFDDDRVLRYTSAYDIAGGIGEACSRSKARLGEKIYQSFYYLWF